MLQPNEIDFYLQREGEERALAERASSGRTRDIHRGLAERYAELAGRLSENAASAAIAG